MLKYEVPKLALLAEFDRIVTGEARGDDAEYHDLVLAAIRGTLSNSDRFRQVIELLVCAACGHQFNCQCRDAPDCQTHILVKLILAKVAIPDPSTASNN